MELQTMNEKLHEVTERWDISEDWRIKLQWKLRKPMGWTTPRTLMRFPSKPEKTAV